jgi:membrane protein
LVGVLAFLFGPDRAQRELVQLISDVYPSATAQETRIARELVEGRALSLTLGVIGTVLATRAIHGSLDSAFELVFGRKGRRSFVRGQVEAFGFVAGLALLAVVSFVVSYGAVAAQDALGAVGFEGPVRVLFGLVSPLLGLAAGYVLFYAIYRVIPRSPMPPGSARIAALVSSVLWELAKIAFGFFTRALGIFSAYGPIAFAAGLLTWIYLTAVIILIGAEVIKVSKASA